MITLSEGRKLVGCFLNSWSSLRLPLTATEGKEAIMEAWRFSSKELHAEGSWGGRGCLSAPLSVSDKFCGGKECSRSLN